MDANKLILAAEQLKQGLLAVSTNGTYADKDHKNDIAILMSDQRVSKMLPAIIKVNRTPDDFRRAMQAKFKHYDERRNYIGELLDPVLEYLQDVLSGNDRFTQKILEDEIGENIGHGGFGSVYKYHHKLLDMNFALKLFEPVFVSNEENIEGEKRFFREAKILFSLNHENIVRVYDIGRTNGQPYIRMEFVDGMTIQDFVKKNGSVSFKRSLKPITALLSGLKYAHELGVIHRDLKPTNFMVTDDGKFKIIDFGISAFLETEGYTKLTKTGEAVVGGAYTDPQLSENPKLRDVRSDIYSVGSIWYYLLVGHAPMGGDLKKNLIETGNATELESSIILKCLSSNLDDRYSSCEELLNIIAPSDAANAKTADNKSANNITEITRQAIFDYIIDRNRWDMESYVYGAIVDYQEHEKVFYYYGRRNQIQFMERLYNLDTSANGGSETLRQEIYRHTIQNDDYPYGWLFEDERFGLVNGDDETFLKFIAMMFHPVIRNEECDWESALNEINSLLQQDGYEIYDSGKVSGKSVYSYRYCI